MSRLKKPLNPEGIQRLMGIKAYLHIPEKDTHFFELFVRVYDSVSRKGVHSTNKRFSCLRIGPGDNFGIGIVRINFFLPLILGV